MPANVANLKSALWDAANTLRGSAVDRTDWKGYILPLLFFKRISDVWDEETAEAVTELSFDRIRHGSSSSHRSGALTPGPCGDTEVCMLRKFKSLGVRFRQVARLPGGTRTFRMDGPRDAESEDGRHFGIALRGRHGLGPGV